ncbi:hypothetical protein BK667_23755 [Pseudomonas frederiksbergensis]|nr:hypothetical protein BK667_23755 [Pseudomonas frederiksbergensis]
MIAPPLIIFWNGTAAQDVVCIRHLVGVEIAYRYGGGIMNNIIYIVGAVVIALVILSFVGIV